MSEPTPVFAQPPAAPNAAGGVVAHSAVDSPGQNQPSNVKTDMAKVQPKKPEETHDTSLSYSVDRDAGALRLKVSNHKGETIRELTFTDFVSTMKSSSLAKGVWVDDRS